ncbi:MAG: hypothetical protein GC162_10810 [Planctomycetes bacterium]|nr:hypothetical protein [Planctomycetota bacterium]
MDGSQRRFGRWVWCTLVMVPSLAQAASQTWNGTTDGLWATGTNWSGGAAPGITSVSTTSGQTTNIATFNNAGNGNTAITVDANRIIGQIVFDTSSAAAYTFGGSKLVLDTTVFGPGITINAGVTTNQIFNVNIGNLSAPVYTNNGSGTLTFNGVLSRENSSNGTQQFDGTGTIIVNGNFASSIGTVNKNGTGTLELNGANLYNNTLVLNNGTVKIGNTAALNGKAVDFGSNANTKTLQLNSTSVAIAGIDTGATVGTSIVENGGASNATLTINNSSGTFTYAGTLQDGSGGGTLALTRSTAGGTLTLSGTASYSGQTTVSNGTLNLTGAFSGTSNISATGGILNLTNAFSGNGNVSVAGGTVNVTGLHSGSGSVTVSSGTYTDSANITNMSTLGVSGGSANLSGNISSMSGATLTAGTTTLSGNNSFNGAIALSSTAVLNIQSNTALGSTVGGTTVGSGARLELQGNITVTGESLTIAGTGTNNIGALQTKTGDNIWDGNILLSNVANTRIGADAGSLTVTGVISDGANTVDLNVRNNTGTTILSGVSTYKGATNIVVGLLKIDVGNDRLPTGTTLHLGNGTNVGTATFDLNARNQTVAGLVNDGTTMSMLITNNGGSASTFTVNNASANSFSGNINSGASALNLVKGGAGTLTLLATNTYGTTTINAGTLQIGNNGTVGTLGTGAVTDNGTLNINRSDNVTIANDISGTGALTKSALNTVTLTGNNSYGATTISSGTLQVGNGGTTGSIGTGAVTNTGTLTFNRSDSITVANAISGTLGNVIQLGSGTTILTGANSYTGTTTITAGTLQIGNGGTIGTLGTGSVTDNGILAFNRSDNITVSNAISGSGSLTKSAANTLILTGGNSYGATTISAGTLQIGNGGTTGSLGTGNVTDNGTLTFNRSNSLTVNNDISGSGALTHSGSGSLTLGGNNSYAGTTTASNGNLIIASSTALGSTAGVTNITSTATKLILSNNISVVGETVNTTYLQNLSGTNSWSGAVSNNANAQLTLESLAGSMTISGAVNAAFAGNHTLNLRGAGDGTLSGNVTGVFAFNKLDGGTWTISGASKTWTGEGSTNTVGAGKLLLDTGITSDRPWAVSGGATLGGVGSITASSLTVNGTIAPGDSPGTFTMNGALNLNNEYLFEQVGGVADRISVNGTLTLGASSVLNITTSLSGMVIILADYTTLNGSFGTILNQQGHSIDYNYLGLHQIALLIPTPAALPAGLMLMAGLIGRRKR